MFRGESYPLSKEVPLDPKDTITNGHAVAADPLPQAGSSTGMENGDKERTLRLISFSDSETTTKTDRANPSTVSGPCALASSNAGVSSLIDAKAFRSEISAKAKRNPTEATQGTIR